MVATVYSKHQFQSCFVEFIQSLVQSLYLRIWEKFRHSIVARAKSSQNRLSPELKHWNYPLRIAPVAKLSDSLLITVNFFSRGISYFLSTYACRRDFVWIYLGMKPCPLPWRPIVQATHNLQSKSHSIKTTHSLQRAFYLWHPSLNT